MGASGVNQAALRRRSAQRSSARSGIAAARCGEPRESASEPDADSAPDSDPDSDSDSDSDSDPDPDSDSDPDSVSGPDSAPDPIRGRSTGQVAMAAFGGTPCGVPFVIFGDPPEVRACGDADAFRRFRGPADGGVWWRCDVSAV